METLARVHEGVTTIIGSMSDAAGIALAFHLDRWMTIGVLGACFGHVSVSAILWVHRRRPVRRKRIVGFVPPMSDKRKHK